MNRPRRIAFPTFVFLNLLAATAPAAESRNTADRPAFGTAGAITGSGSDHMQKIGDWRAINIYNPFLAMWVTITRGAKWYEGQMYPEEALSRAQAIQFLTRNNAYLLFWEKEIGSLESGKRADLIVVDRDVLTCPVDDVRDTQVLQTWVEGRSVYRKTP